MAQNFLWKPGQLRPWGKFINHKCVCMYIYTPKARKPKHSTQSTNHLAQPPSQHSYVYTMYIETKRVFPSQTLNFLA